MNTLRLVEPPKDKFSWTKEILALNTGEGFKAKKKYAKTISPRISREVKLEDPNRVFETDSKSDPKYIIVKRTA
jgi:hypothetical protein